MFANPLWSVAILAGLVVAYFIMRYRHGGPLLGTSHTWGEWFVAFRSWVVNASGSLLIAAPDIIVSILSVDLSPLIGEAWASRIMTFMAIYNTINTPFRTKPEGATA